MNVKLVREESPPLRASQWDSHRFSLVFPEGKQSPFSPVTSRDESNMKPHPTSRVPLLATLICNEKKKMSIASTLNSYIYFGGVQNVVVSLVTKWPFCRHEWVVVWQNEPRLEVRQARVWILALPLSTDKFPPYLFSVQWDWLCCWRD